MTKELLRTSPRKAALLVAVMFWAGTANSYSVLTHQELIDSAWNESIRPLLLAKFPGATDAQLVEAHAYAYGGCAIQDMGYYPFGKQFFSALLTMCVPVISWCGFSAMRARSMNMRLQLERYPTTWAIPLVIRKPSIRRPPLLFQTWRTSSGPR